MLTIMVVFMVTFYLVLCLVAHSYVAEHFENHRPLMTRSVEPELGHDGDSQQGTDIINPSSSPGTEVDHAQHLDTSAALRMSPCAYKHVTVDCSGLGLGNIEPDWFPTDSEMILLNSNHLTRLSKSSFSHLRSLKYLDLSYNYIDHIELGAFEGLFGLVKLNLSYNCVSFTGALNTTEVFKPLKALRDLDIIQNQYVSNGNASYTGLHNLKNLRFLSIGYFEENLYLGPEFRLFEKLESLKITGSVKFIQDNAFENLSGLKELHLIQMRDIVNISQKVFEPLKSLTSLQISNLKTDLQYFLTLLKPFVGRNMSEIFLDSVSMHRKKVYQITKGFLGVKDTKYLVNICLNSFTLINSYITYIYPNAMGGSPVWRSCLRNLKISDNPLEGSSSELYRLLNYKNLETITVNNAFRGCNKFEEFPSFMGANISKVASSSEIPVGVTKVQMNKVYNSTLAQSCTPPCQIITVPKNLKSINFGRLINSMPLDKNLQFVGAKNLEYANVEDSGFHTCVGNIHGLTSLKTAVFSGNKMRDLSETFFDGFSGLENLALSKCLIQRDFMAFQSHRLFQNLKELRQLDLSFNSLNAFSNATFSFNSNLQFLNLSDNQFNYLPFNLKHTPELRVFDVTNNSIITINIDARHELDHLALRNGGFRLFLRGNILSCGCSDLLFLQWLKNTLVELDQGGNFSCIDKDGERSYTLCHQDLESLWRPCWGQYFLSIAVIIVCLYVIVFFIVFLYIKRKTFIISYFLQLFGHFHLRSRQDYKIDVFLGYSDTDYRFPCQDLRAYLEDTLKLTTFLNDRDLLATLNKASGIVEAINSSWRVLLVCSEGFLKDEDWSLFTMRSAMYAQSPANPGRVVVMVHQRCLRLLPTELLSAVEEDNILVVSEWKISYEMGEMLRTRLS
ncbi:toll-like receptor 4 [Biomphalaria glabrata]|uniref:Toll-like receptor 4 n=1 Tax=Biomphalaria glabrata TaxID=6526 RepID=A0A9W2YSV1_BIOGL|nr:toll-like receptor 4 [Biomphalaria glabrata]